MLKRTLFILATMLSQDADISNTKNVKPYTSLKNPVSYRIEINNSIYVTFI